MACLRRGGDDVVEGKDTSSVTGNVLRDYHTDVDAKANADLRPSETLNAILAAI